MDTASPPKRRVEEKKVERRRKTLTLVGLNCLQAMVSTYVMGKKSISFATKIMGRKKEG